MTRKRTSAARDDENSGSEAAQSPELAAEHAKREDSSATEATRRKQASHETASRKQPLAGDARAAASGRTAAPSKQDDKRTGRGGSGSAKAASGKRVAGSGKAGASGGKVGGAGAKPGARTPLDELGGRPGFEDLTGVSQRRIDEIREFALDIARRGAEPGMMIVCNRISEPTPLPAKELLYDRCGWCDADIYYDRLMPSPPDVTRVCIPCALVLMKAEKKGAN